MAVWTLRSEMTARATVVREPIVWSELELERWLIELGGIAWFGAAVGLFLYFRELRGGGRVPGRVVLAVAGGLCVSGLVWCRVPVVATWAGDGGTDGGLRWARLADDWRGFEMTPEGQWNCDVLWPLQACLALVTLGFSAWLVVQALRRSWRPEDRPPPAARLVLLA